MNSIKTDKKLFRPYRWHTGSLAWALHRVTGILLFFYIFLHLYVINKLKDPEEYKATITFMNDPSIKLGEIALLGLVLAHALNGIRLTLIDIGVSTKLHKIIFWMSVCVGFVILIIGGLYILRGSK
ncbi:MAG: succinate dehydrogenase, cytochrome b556 subunit [Nitrospirae bacterium]|nr:succinate dehydrogenase, cytochrome b556 subunit [Nitrospirota bacterium]